MSTKQPIPRNILSAGPLIEANFINGFALFTGYGLRPSDLRSAKITIENAGSEGALMRLFELEASSTFAAGDLTLLIVEEGQAPRELYRGEIGSLPPASIHLGVFAPGERRTYRFIVTLGIDSPNGGQGRGAGAIYEWRAEPDSLGGREVAVAESADRLDRLR